MKRNISNARSHLGELDGLASQTEASERGILQRAAARLEQVQAMIERQRPGIEAASDAAQDRYTELITERGQLHAVIAKARRALAV